MHGGQHVYAVGGPQDFLFKFVVVDMAVLVLMGEYLGRASSNQFWNGRTGTSGEMLHVHQLFGA